MRNFIVLGASALVLALGVAQASAIPSYEQTQERVAAQNAALAAAANNDLSGFRAQATDQGAFAVQAPSPLSHHTGR